MYKCFDCCLRIANKKSIKITTSSIHLKKWFENYFIMAAPCNGKKEARIILFPKVTNQYLFIGCDQVHYLHCRCKLR